MNNKNNNIVNFNGVRKIGKVYIAQLYFEGKFTIVGEYKTEEQAEDEYDNEC